MLPECQSAEVRHAELAAAVPPAACCTYGEPLDPSMGWYLVQRDWGARQDEPATEPSCPLARALGVWPRLRARFAPRRRSLASASR
jgi:hypothetical protein